MTAEAKKIFVIWKHQLRLFARNVNADNRKTGAKTEVSDETAHLAGKNQNKEISQQLNQRLMPRLKNGNQLMQQNLLKSKNWLEQALIRTQY